MFKAFKTYFKNRAIRKKIKAIEAHLNEGGKVYIVDKDSIGGVVAEIFEIDGSAKQEIVDILSGTNTKKIIRVEWSYHQKKVSWGDEILNLREQRNSAYFIVFILFVCLGIAFYYDNKTATLLKNAEIKNVVATGLPDCRYGKERYFLISYLHAGNDGQAFGSGQTAIMMTNGLFPPSSLAAFLEKKFNLKKVTIMSILELTKTDYEDYNKQ